MNEKIMNKGLQIYLLKEYFKKNGYENNLDKIDFDKFFDSTLTYYENLRNMIIIVGKLGLEKDYKSEGYDSGIVDPDAHDEEADETEKKRKLSDFRKKLTDEFNRSEGLNLEEKEFELLLSKCDVLLKDLEIIPNSSGNNEAPNFLPPEDYSTIIKEISSILKRKPKPIEPKPEPSFNEDGIREGVSLCI